MQENKEVQFSKVIQQQLKTRGIYGLGESFIDGQWENQDIDKLLFDIFTDKNILSRSATFKVILKKIEEIFFNKQVGSGVFKVAEKHYDLGNDLFQNMLDESMTYTSGIWKNVSDLKQSQEAKLDLICQKLSLKSGMKVLDIGCGWGNFAEFAAKKYRVNVVGITVSKEQAAYAVERCKNLSVEIRIQDYRKVEEQFDRIVSIEMIEAVGRKNIGTFFQIVDRNLNAGGIFVLQAITGEAMSGYSNPNLDNFLLWLVKYIFPNGYLPKLRQLVKPYGTSLIVDNIEEFGLSYDKTLKEWRKNFIENWPNIQKSYDDKFYRMWIFYLSSCAALFRARMVQLHQIVYSKVQV